MKYKKSFVFKKLIYLCHLSHLQKLSAYSSDRYQVVNILCIEVTIMESDHVIIKTYIAVEVGSPWEVPSFDKICLPPVYINVRDR